MVGGNKKEEMLAKKKIVVSVAVLLAILLVGTVITQGISTPATIKDQPRVFQWDTMRQPRLAGDGGAAHIYPPVGTPKVYPKQYRPIPEPIIEPILKLPEPPEEPEDVNYTRLLISSRYERFEMEPGDKTEFTVTVKHDENKSVSTQVHIEIPPYCDYCLEEDWITVEPMSAEIAAGVKQDYSVTVKIPDDAKIGYYNAQIVFTNDTWSMPYPEKFPAYVNACELSINVWTPPKIYFWPQHISDRVKAGQSYEYEILLENIGDNAIAINPEIGGEKERPEVVPLPPFPYGYNEGRIPDDWLTIDAPADVPANSTATVKVTMNVPEDAFGWYETEINLNIDDPEIEEWDQTVHMNIEVWKQPTTPYSDEFSVEQGEAISVMVTARGYKHGSYNRAEEEPSFNVELSSPSSEKVTPESSKTVKKREVSLGMKYEPYYPGGTASEEPYHVRYTEYSKTYKVTNATGGQWTLEILPINVQNFEYTIEIGE